MASEPDLAEYLTVIDSRTQQKYTIDITNNSVKATDFSQITPFPPTTNPENQTTSGLRIFDKGFLNTACVESSITFIDGNRGQIRYRNYSINELFENNDYEDVLHLLIWGHLPSSQEKMKVRSALAAEMNPPQSVVDTIQSFPRDSPPCPMIIGGMSAFAAVDEGATKVHSQRRPYYLGNTKAVDAAIIKSMAIFATTVALVYCHKRGHSFTPADPNGSYIGNLLRMMGFGRNKKDGIRVGEVEKCLERVWILYADHEMTNSTTAFLHAASTLTDPISSSIPCIVSAHGPLHGGAIDLVYKEFEQVGSVENVPRLIEEVKAKKQRLFGYGHRIYKTVDPRTLHIREMIDEHLEGSKAASDPLLQVAIEIDRIASSDSYFVSRNLHANADLYGALLYSILGFETDIIVAMTCVARGAGIMAHWREAMQQGPMLWRPQQMYTELAQPQNGST
ncbi:citrate synthase [Whalleya microplaca]|nr:citrate synthase [Whalleya microplaca]